MAGMTTHNDPVDDFVAACHALTNGEEIDRAEFTIIASRFADCLSLEREATTAYESWRRVSDAALQWALFGDRETREILIFLWRSTAMLMTIKKASERRFMASTPTDPLYPTGERI